MPLTKSREKKKKREKKHWGYTHPGIVGDPVHHHYKYIIIIIMLHEVVEMTRGILVILSAEIVTILLLKLFHLGFLKKKWFIVKRGLFF